MNAVNPLAKISTLLGVAAIADPQQNLNANADSLAKGKSLLLNNGLLQKVAAYNSGAIAEVSLTAHLIDDSIQQANAAGINETYHAKSVVSTLPKMPAVMAEALRQTIENSGLFYESHLKNFVEGRRNLDMILLEPQNQIQSQAQNQTSTIAHGLLPQQLAVLEHQRISWQGQVWPNQEMSWQINWTQERDKNKSQLEPVNTDTQATVSSDITLYLPHLGKVTAKLQLNGGRVRINMLAEDAQTLITLKTQSKVLISAMQGSGQRLEALTLVQDRGNGND